MLDGTSFLHPARTQIPLQVLCGHMTVQQRRQGNSAVRRTAYGGNIGFRVKDSAVHQIGAELLFGNQASDLWLHMYLEHT